MLLKVRLQTGTAWAVLARRRVLLGWGMCAAQWGFSPSVFQIGKSCQHLKKKKIGKNPLTDVLQISSTVPQHAKTLFVVNFDKQKFLILMKFTFSIFSSMVRARYALCIYIKKKKKKTSLWNSWRYYPMLSSSSFIVVPFTFSSRTHIEFIQGHGRDPGLFFGPMDSQLLQRHLLKIPPAPSPTGLWWGLYWKSRNHIRGDVSRLSILCHGSTWLTCATMPHSQWLWL